MKRNRLQKEENQNQLLRDVKIRADLDSKFSKSYTGYKLLEAGNSSVDTVELPKTNDEVQNFFDRYVRARKPCKILGVSPEAFPQDELKPSRITDYLRSDEILTVETKNDGGFGSGAKRVKMTFGQFMTKLIQEGDHNLYLTTQYIEDDPIALDSEIETDEEDKDQVLQNEEDEDSLIFQDMHDDFEELEQNESNTEHDEELEMRLKELYQPPMTNLVNILPEVPEFLNYLIPQQINLWVGSSPTPAIYNNNVDSNWLSNFNPNDERLGLGRNVPGGGSSSGLHHDHADNLYIPVSGHKRFTLFSPSDAAKMYTVGNIRQIYASGVIDYVPDSKAPSWKRLRDDGALLSEVYNFVLDQNSKDHQLSEQDVISYKSFVETEEARNQLNPDKLDNLDPPSFSEIPPSAVHMDKIRDGTIRRKVLDIIKEKWPLFQSASRLTVELQPGEMLYLPAGWFHEVTSYGDASSQANCNDVHVAVNYWFVPPTGHQIDNVYPHEDRYWPKDFELTKKALNWIRNR